MELWLFKVAGCLSLVAALMHIAIIFGGPDWYRFFGAGEAMAQMASRGELKPTLITFGIASVLFIWSLYAFSAAGLLLRLPLLQLGLIAITAVYLVRGVLGLFAPLFIHFSNYPAVQSAVMQNSVSFWIWSSVICLFFGLVHLIALISNWSSFSAN